MKFRKKPVEVEAVQLTKWNIEAVQKWANTIMPADKQVEKGFQPVCEDPDKWPCIGLLIPTKEGNMQCSFGDYLIKEPFPTDDRMFYPCKADMFELTYDPVNE